jgi:predicted MFS family arabinose efflux permease
MFVEHRTFTERSNMRRGTIWITALFVATLSLGTDEFVIAGVLNRVADDLQISPGVTGQLVTAYAFAFALGAPVLGVWADRFPRKNTLVSGLLLFAVANVVCALASDFAPLLILRIIAGLSAAVVSTTAFTAAAEGAPDGRQGSYLSVVTAGLTVALFTGVPLGTWMAGVMTWRATFVMIAAVALLAAGVIAASLPHLSGSRSRTLRERVAPLRNPGVLRMVGSIFLCGGGGLMFYTYLGPLTRYAFGDDSALTMFLLIVGIVGVASALLGGILSDRFGPRSARISILAGHSAALTAIGGAVLMGAPLWAAAIGIGAWSIFAWALNPPMQASTIAAAPDAAMTAVSLNISGLYAGTAIAAALGGIVVDSVGVQAIPFVAAASLLCACLLAAPTVTARRACTEDVMDAHDHCPARSA